jgi:hypothetical protein
LLTVQVFSRHSGNPVKSVKVSIQWGTTHSGPVYTDAAGDAHFSVGPGSGQVYVDGRLVKAGHLSGRVAVYT